MMRDPRVEPVKGDVLETPWREITVLERTLAPPFVMFSTRIKIPLGGLSGSEKDWLTPKAWMDEYKHAAVTQRGDDTP